MSAKDKLDRAHQRLESLRKSQLRIEGQAWLFTAAALIAVLIASATLFEASAHLTSPIRTVVFIVLLLSLPAGAAFIWLKLSTDPRLKPSRAALEWWALELGKSAPKVLRDRLLNAIQIADPTPPHRDNPSEALALDALFRAVSDMDSTPDVGVFDHRRRTRGLKMLAGAFVFTALVVVISPSAQLAAFNRLIHPTRQFITPPAFTLKVEPAGGWQYRGEAFDFTISADGDAPRRVEFIYRYEQGESQSIDVPLSNGQGSLHFDGFAAPVLYSVRSHDVTTVEYRLDIISRPQIAELHYRLFPPRYSRQPVATGVENTGDVEALPGSEIELNIRSTKALSACWLNITPTGGDSTHIDSVAMTVSGASALTRVKLNRESRYTVRLIDTGGHRDVDPITYRIRMLADEYPMVRIAFPDSDIEMGDQLALPVRLEAEDDFGVSRVNLMHRVLEVDTIAAARYVKLDNPGARMVASEFHWDIGDLAMMPGDVLEYWAVAWDNDDVSGPKSAESERRMIRLPSFEEIIAGVDQTEEGSIEEAVGAIQAAKDLREQVADIIQELRRNPKLDWEKQRSIESTLEQQDALTRKLDEFAERLNELVEKFEKHDLTTAETFEKYQELQKLIAEISTPELREAMEKLRQALESQDPDELAKALEKFDLNREEFLQGIERSLNILRQLQLERKIDELVRRVEDLLHRQEKVLEQMNGADPDKLAGEQRQLASETDQLDEKIAEASELAAEMGEEALQAELEEVNAHLQDKNIPRGMRQTADLLAERRAEQASAQGEQNARDLAEVAGKLSRASQDLKDRRKMELAGKIRRIAEEMLYVSGDLEDLASQSRNLGTQSPRYRALSTKQGEIKQALGGITNELFAASRETFFITPALGALLGKASDDMDKALDGYTDRNPRSVSTPQFGALGAINRTVKHLLDILAEMENASSSTGYDEMMQKLSQMASAQQGLNQQSMPVPGPGGENQMPFGSEGMKRLAAQQRALRAQMEELAAGAQGMGEILGDLENIAAEMGEVENDFEASDIDERTRRLQRQIVSRLLDATRSAKQQDYSKKRESKAGLDLTRKSPNAPSMDIDESQLRRDLLRAIQEGYSRDFRRVVRSYFQSLENIQKSER